HVLDALFPSALGGTRAIPGIEGDIDEFVEQNQALQLDLNVYQKPLQIDLNICEEQNEIHEGEVEEETAELDGVNGESADLEGSNLLTLNQEEIRGCLVGEVRPTLDDIYELYCQHASIVGFSVRKAKNREKEGTQIIKEKYYFCSAQGERNTGKKKEENEPMIEKSTSTKVKKRKKRKVMVTRTGCNALIRAKMNKNGEFEIVHHVISERQMNQPKEQAIEAMQECGLRPIDSYRYMCTEAGGEDALGHSKKDHFNCCYRLKMKSIEGKDSQMVVDKLYEQMQEDNEFFFRIFPNSRHRLCL
ncbi:Protein FAR1-RELATED SEQUENCE 5, partial [Bienertia sinuspersici]